MIISLRPLTVSVPSSARRRLRPVARTAARTLACAALLAVACSGALAQAIYKSVDATGRVIYSQEPVAGAVSVEKVDVAPKVAVDRPGGGAGQAAAEAKRAETQRQSEELRQRQQSRDAQRQKALDEVTAAERDLASAQKAFETGQEPSELGDRQGIGGVRSRPTDQYLDRVRRLEAEVEAAKKRLAEAQNRLRDTQQ